jgi:serine/threonine protein kinase
MDLDSNSIFADSGGEVGESTPAGSIPAELGGYRIVRELYPDETFAAIAPGGRRVVLKLLDADCLLNGALHPAVRERLARVRELAHAGVANLHSVERDQGRIYLVWDFVEGMTLDEWALDRPDGAPDDSRRDLARVARELVLCAESLHARGIVHGSIHGRNALLDDSGRLRLTHVSPFLYNDPADDAAAIVDLLHELSGAKGWTGTPLQRMLQSARERTPSLRELGSRIAALIELRDGGPWRAEDPRGQRRRRFTTALAGAAAAVVACALWLGMRAYVARQSPAPPRPAQADPEAMR